MTAATTTPVEVVANAPESSSDASGSTLRILLALAGLAVVVGGVVWVVRNKKLESVASAKSLEGGRTPLPDINPWASLDELMAEAPQQQTVEVEGDGYTAKGTHYVWRIYRGSVQGDDQDSAVFQAIVMYEGQDGEFVYWGEDQQSPRFVLADTEQGAMDKIAEWGDQN